MLKAGALLYAIVIALLIAMLSSTFIFYQYYTKLHIGYLSRQERLIRNAQSGINLLMSDQELVALDSKLTQDLYQQGKDSVFLQRRSWGLYEIAMASSFVAHQRITRVVQTGEKLEEQSYPALYLADMDKPLSVCGKTELNGLCYLPKAGVKRAYIEGESFAGDKMVNGLVKPSSRNLPELDPEMLKAIKNGFDISYWQAQGDSIISIDEKEIKDTMRNSFLNKTICFFSKASITLSRKVISGNVVVVSESEINIKNDVALDGVLLYAPKINIEKSTIATVQAFANDSLVVGEKSILNYPSALAVIRRIKSPDFPTLRVKEESKVTGVIIAWEEIATPQRQVKIALDKKTEVTGQVYSSSLMDLKGIVIGSVMCSRLMLSTPSSVYENHLLNTVIDQTKLSKNFAGVELMKKASEKRILKWLE